VSMNAAIWAGLFCLIGSCGQLLVPSRVYTQPTDVVFGLPVVPVLVLAVSATLFTVGVILVAEGVCHRLGAPSLGSLATADPVRFVRVLLAGAAAGLVLEIVAEWLGRLWVYPYWTVWLYALIVVPGFAFYWLSIVDSYLAAKAVLDRFTWPGRRVAPTRLTSLGLIGVTSLSVALLLYLQWYAHRSDPPPFWYAVVTVVGVCATAESMLSRRGRPSLLGSLRRGYFSPVAAIVFASASLGIVMEAQNAVHRLWAYQNWPGGLPAVLAAWPLQYAVFLVLPALFVPELAALFFTPTHSPHPHR